MVDEVFRNSSKPHGWIGFVRNLLPLSGSDSRKMHLSESLSPVEVRFDWSMRMESRRSLPFEFRRFFLGKKREDCYGARPLAPSPSRPDMRPQQITDDLKKFLGEYLSHRA